MSVFIPAKVMQTFVILTVIHNILLIVYIQIHFAGDNHILFES